MSIDHPYKAADGHILVLRLDASTRKSDIVLPETVTFQQDKYEVLDVGFGVERINVGDFVVYKDSSVFLGGNVTVKDHAVFIDEKRGIISVRKENVVAIVRKDHPEAEAKFIAIRKASK